MDYCNGKPERTDAKRTENENCDGELKHLQYSKTNTYIVKEANVRFLFKI